MSAQSVPTREPDTFFVQENVLTDQSKTYDVMVRDTYGEVHLFWPATSESAAEACADALTLCANNWR